MIGYFEDGISEAAIQPVGTSPPKAGTSETFEIFDTITNSRKDDNSVGLLKGSPAPQNVSRQLSQKEALGIENKNTPTRIKTSLEYLHLF